MGNEVSNLEYEGPPEVLKGRDIQSVADYIKSDQCKNVFLMVSVLFTPLRSSRGLILSRYTSSVQVHTSRCKLLDQLLHCVAGSYKVSALALVFLTSDHQKQVCTDCWGCIIIELTFFMLGLYVRPLILKIALV